MSNGTDHPAEPGFSSPWPLFVAVGVVLSEVGVILGVFPVAVGGLLLLSGSVAGILRESAYIESPWPLLGLFGTALLCSGLALYVLGGGTVSTVSGASGLSVRGLAIVVAGLLVLFGALFGWLWPQRETSLSA